MKMENTKYEARNTKQILNSNVSMIQTRWFGGLVIRISNLFRISDFGFRILLIVSLAAFCVKGYAAEPTPKELQDIGISPRFGEQLPLDLTFQNENGETVALQTFFDGKHPVIMALAYYECPNLCTFLLNGATEGMRKMDWTTGDQFQFVTVSIDPKENFQLAAKKKEAYLKAYGKPDGDKGWSFLTGHEENIKKLASSLGFKYRYDEETKQYAHAAGLFVITPDGKIARLLQGIQFAPRDLRLSLVEASQGKIGALTDKILLFCFRYDPKTSKYGLMASNMMKAGGAVAILMLGFLILKNNKKKGA